MVIRRGIVKHVMRRAAVVAVWSAWVAVPVRCWRSVLGPLAAAPPALADEFDVIIDPIINSLIGWRARRPWSVEVDGRRVGVAVCG